MASASGKYLRLAAFLLPVVTIAATGVRGAENLHHDPQDQVLQQVGVDERPGAQIPLDLLFATRDGTMVKLGEFFTGEPVILTLNYYDCPMLCPLIFRNLVNTTKGISGLSLARDYRIVTVSFNPEETLARAKEKSEETYAMLGAVANPEQRWPFLLGKGTEIERLTNVVGFRYSRLDRNNFAHPAVILVVTPEGKVARYLYGMEHSPQDLKLALIEASRGRIGGSTLLNRVLLYCYHYDPVGKKYALAAMNVMKLAGGASVALLGILLLALWRRERRRHEGTSR